MELPGIKNGIRCTTTMVALSNLSPSVISEILAVLPDLSWFKPTSLEEPYYRGCKRFDICELCKVIFVHNVKCPEFDAHANLPNHKLYSFSSVKPDIERLTCTLHDDGRPSFQIVEAFIQHQRRHTIPAYALITQEIPYRQVQMPFCAKYPDNHRKSSASPSGDASTSPTGPEVARDLPLPELIPLYDSFGVPLHFHRDSLMTLRSASYDAQGYQQNFERHTDKSMSPRFGVSPGRPNHSVLSHCPGDGLSWDYRSSPNHTLDLSMKTMHAEASCNSQGALHNPKEIARGVKDELTNAANGRDNMGFHRQVHGRPAP